MPQMLCSRYDTKTGLFFGFNDIHNPKPTSKKDILAEYTRRKKQYGDVYYSLDDDGLTCSPRKNNNGSYIINRAEYPVADPIWELMKSEEYPKIIDDTTTFDKWKLTKLRYPNGGHFDWIVLHDRINDVHIQISPQNWIEISTRIDIIKGEILTPLRYCGYGRVSL